MFVKLVLSLTLFYVVFSNVSSEKSYDGRPFMQGYIRTKRGKYYSSPQRFYSRPPASPQIKGFYSYTPPPNYMADNDSQYPGPPSFPGPSYPGPPSFSGPPSYPGPPLSRPPKVSKRPTNDGLGDEDINNIVKYLSKKDLNKIIELAGGKDQDSDFDSNPFDKYNNSPPKDDLKSTRINLYDDETDKYPTKPISDDDNKLFKRLVQEIDTDIKSANYQESKPFVFDYNPKKPSVNYVTQPTPQEEYFNNQNNNNNLYDTDNAALAAEENMLKRQIEYLKSQINDGVVYTDSKIMPEEKLPKPMNLREEQDYVVSYTNNVQNVVKAEQGSSYKLENFGDLPVMNYDSKLDSVSSYHVPHYTVTSSSSIKQPPPAYFPPPSLSLPHSPKVPTVEPAPPPSAAKAQSDAHLKAVRIWSHKSKGTAYTLHDDGSLSLEKPGRPKGGYGHP